MSVAITGQPADYRLIKHLIPAPAGGVKSDGYEREIFRDLSMETDLQDKLILQGAVVQICFLKLIYF